VGIIAADQWNYPTLFNAIFFAEIKNKIPFGRLAIDTKVTDRCTDLTSIKYAIFNIKYV
jgi:hypothetical protein